MNRAGRSPRALQCFFSTSQALSRHFNHVIEAWQLMMLTKDTSTSLTAEICRENKTRVDVIPDPSAAKRIAAPNQPPLRGISKISGSDLIIYRSKVWVPRINNSGLKGTVFPKELKAHGLDEELLVKVFSQVMDGKKQQTSSVAFESSS
uniref:Uncharacterized protein n=1 Tax=Amphimedon queenslandica TaxID=400682 RepID=A0A1X7VWN4_AMPQE